MPILQLQFPGGRYHATPWDHHVNEGQIEWPPSPWRLLRALIACGFATQRWHEVPLPARRLILKLAATPPSYCLPAASGAHSRHYMPVGSFKKPSNPKQVSRFEFAATDRQCADLNNYFVEDTTMVYDTWADVGNDALMVYWDCNLTDVETDQLRQLAECLGYLGRSESWVEGQLLPEDVAPPDAFDAVPHRDGMHLGPEWEQVSLMAPIPPEQYDAWRDHSTQAVLADYPLPEGKKKPPAKLLKERDKAVSPYPESLLDCLTKDTAWWKGHRWSQPPGSQRVIYWRRSDSLLVSPPQRPRLGAVQTVDSMLLAISTPSGNRSALPPCKWTLIEAEKLHRAIVGRAANGERVYCPELTGRDEHGAPLRQCHQHAHLWPVDLDEDGRLDHFIVYAPMGLGATAQQAIRRVRAMWTRKGENDLQLALAGMGGLDTLRELPAHFGRRMGQLLGPRQGARVWMSVTPFVPPRFLKQRGANTLLGQINAELASRQLPAVKQLDPMPNTPSTLRLRHYTRTRRSGGAPPPVDVGFALRLQFSEPVPGPIALGYASHFGLGLFAALDE